MRCVPKCCDAEHSQLRRAVFASVDYAAVLPDSEEPCDDLGCGGGHNDLPFSVPTVQVNPGARAGPGIGAALWGGSDRPHRRIDIDDFEHHQSWRIVSLA
jgi:hypothetical protein